MGAVPRAATHEPAGDPVLHHAVHDAATRPPPARCGRAVRRARGGEPPRSRERAPAPPRTAGAGARQRSCSRGGSTRRRACRASCAARGVVALPVSIDMPQPSAARDPIVVTYAGNPDKKGLELVARRGTWQRPQGRRLVVTGIAAEARPHVPARARRERARGHRVGRHAAAGRAPCAGRAGPRSTSPPPGSRSTASPSSRRWPPVRSWSRRRRAGPTRRCRSRAGSNPPSWPPSGRRRRSRRPCAPRSSLPEPARAEYRERARELVAPYSREELRRRLERDVLPLLLR